MKSHQKTRRRVLKEVIVDSCNVVNIDWLIGQLTQAKEKALAKGATDVYVDIDLREDYPNEVDASVTVIGMKIEEPNNVCVSYPCHFVAVQREEEMIFPRYINGGELTTSLEFQKTIYMSCPEQARDFIKKYKAVRDGDDNTAFFKTAEDFLGKLIKFQSTWKSKFKSND